jgi:hydrogenase large subunit
MATITVMDPITRIEGHLKVEVTVDTVNGRTQVTDARCTGTLFRGFETLLVGRAPTDAPILTQRICGVCPVSHGMASTMALEAASRLVPPTNARILRNLTLGANYIQSHILHFYLLAALDYVAGPQKAPWTPAWDVDIRSDTRLDEVVPHMLASLEARRRAHAMGAIFGGRMPLPHTFLPGGFTATPTTERITAFRSQLTWLRNFIQGTYIPDAEALAEVYSDYSAIGAGWRNLVAYGVFDLTNNGQSKLLKRGWVKNATSASTVSTLSTSAISEQVKYSWYSSGTNLNPASGKTTPQHPKSGAYSWLKAPRYSGLPVEAGPLARMWVNGDYRKGVSVMDRHLARAHETLKVATAMDDWLNQLTPGGSVYSSYTAPSTGTGIGLTEAPRGALGHWASISGRNLSQYQIVTPTCWNASPRDDAGVLGPIEKALVGTPITNPDQPIEALRVIHSFDPCLSCAVHVMRPEGKPVIVRAGQVC